MLKLSRCSTITILAVSLIILPLVGRSESNVFETFTMSDRQTTCNEPRNERHENFSIKVPNIGILRAANVNSLEQDKFSFPGYDTLYWHDYTPSSSGHTIRGYQAGFGVKLTPQYYPAIIAGVHHRVFRLSDDSLQIRFVDDDGSGGAPLSTLYKIDTVTTSYSTSFIYHAVPPTCTIWNGSFYLFMLGNKHDNTVFLLNWLRDLTLNAPTGIHWRHDTLGIYSQWTPNGDFEMGTVVEYHDVSIDSLSGLPTSNTVYVDSTYSISTWCQELAGFSESNVPVITNIAGVFSDTGYLSFAPNGTDSATFNWTVNLPEGSYSCTCYTTLSSDSRKTNDTVRFDFSVTTYVPPTIWEAMAPVSRLPSGKRPKSGSCMDGLEATGLIYFLKASNTQDFYSYDPNTNIWTPLETIPKGEKALNDGKKPKKGAAMAAYDNGIYVLRGNNTLGVWKYTALPNYAETLGWKKMADFPTGTKRVKDGSGLVLVEKGGNDYLFASRGAKRSDFYLYDIAGDSWIQVKSPPVGLSGKAGYKKGSCMAYDGENVWVLQGYFGSFFKYNVEADSWTESRWYDYKTYRNRDGKKKKPKHGAALVYHNDWIYMLKGGNTVEMWKIEVGGDTVGDWVQMVEDWDIPLGPRNKKVKDGGCMIKFGPYFFAAKGKNTDEFYRHGLPVETATYAKSITTAQGVMGNKFAFDGFKLTIAPNPAIKVAAVRYTLPVPGPVNIKLYNVTGSLVKSYINTTPAKDGVLLIDAKMLPSGVYILWFDSGEIRVTKKIVLEK